MIIKTKASRKIYDFLSKNLYINLNIIGFIENEPDAEIYVDNEEAPTGIIARKDYFSLVYTENDDFLNEALDTLYKDGFYGFKGVYRPIAEKIKKKFLVNWESRCALYYFPAKEVDLSLIKNPVKPIQIKDAEIIDKYYTYRNDTSLQRIKTDIEKKHSSAVYVDGDIASWVLIHDDNSMGIMFTKEEYRGRGYAVDVSINLADKILKSGKVPFLQINEGNNMSPGLAKKCGFVHQGDFSDWFGVISGTPKELVDMNEASRKQFIESLGENEQLYNTYKGKSLECMYIPSYSVKKDYKAIEGFKVEVAEGSKKIQTWCETLAKGLAIKKDQEADFIDKIKAVVTNEKYEFKLFTGIACDMSVSTVALLRLEDDVCGVYFEASISNEIGKATLIEAITKAEKYDLYMFFVQKAENASEFYKEIGFVLTHNIQ